VLPPFWQESTVDDPDPPFPNQLLASLPRADFELVRPHLRSVEMEQGAVLVGAGAKLSHAYFPHSGIISLIVRLAIGHTVETAMIGRDSVFGASTALDGNVATNDAIVQIPGVASTIDVQELRLAARQSESFRAALIRHEQALLAQTQQSVACNASHQVEARLSRWLLRAHDLLDGDTLRLTQVFLSQMLGVRRASVTDVAIGLEEAGLVHCRRGSIQITDLDGLRNSSCECYATVKAHYDSLRRAD
jgi:CRP-like cAMP-binding protein